MKFQASVWNVPQKLSSLGSYLFTRLLLRATKAKRMSFNMREDSLMGVRYANIGIQRSFHYRILKFNFNRVF
jgi:hypothetical protein